MRCCSVSSPFRITATDGGARAGLLETAHGPVETPVFMPVGTKASVKAMLPGELRDLGARSCSRTPTTSTSAPAPS